MDKDITFPYAWVDTARHELLDDEIGRQRALEVGAAIVPLVDVIKAETFEYESGDFPLLDTKGWPREQYIAFGRWALDMVSAGEESPNISRWHLSRLRIVGAGPSPKNIGNFLEFKRDIGVPANAIPNVAAHRQFNEASDEEIIRIAVGYVRNLGHKITQTQYRKEAAAGNVPTNERLNKAVGGIGNLNELAGYPNIRAWEDDDFIDFGVHFMQANSYDRSLFTERTLNIVAARDKGPWPRVVYERFGWNTFKQKVMEQVDRIEQERVAKISRYRKETTTGILPAAYAALDDESLIYTAGLYKLAAACAPHASQHTLCKLATTKTKKTIEERFKAVSEHLNPGYIEMVGMSLGVLYDIYPEPADPGLVVSYGQAEAARAARRVKRQKTEHPGIHTASVRTAKAA